MPQKQLHPDATDGGAAAAPARSSKKPYTPNADSDFDTVIKKVSDSWAANPLIKLLWLTQPDFVLMITNYSTAFAARKVAGGDRPSETFNLDDLDIKIDAATSEVKAYLRKEFKSAAVAQYARYGIVKESNTYRMPKDRDDRKLNLPLMIAAIATDGFGTEEYGTTFWTTMKTNYETALTAAGTTDGTVSINVGTKNTEKKKIKKVLTSLIFVLRGNYPDTYKEVLRQWGWQKEDY